MNKHRMWLRACTTIAVALLMTVASGARADPPGRVVRLGYMTGQVSFLPAGATDWVQAELNRPLWIGDRLWTATDARAELQMGSSSLRVAPGTSVSIVAFDDRREQYEVTQGTVRLRVRSMDPDDAIEIDTPNLAFAIRSPGDYRVDVDDEATRVAVIRGSAEAFGTQNAYAIDAGRRIRFTGTDLGDYQAVALRADPFDTWAGERIALEERSTSARYVSADMIGYADLDAHGSWRQVPSYGSVWVPTTVAPDWAPYRYGRWTWLDPWGWTWVDDAPWGFAPFHYGRWAFVDSRWCWVPGPRTVRPVYAPALVAFVGGPNIGVSVAVGAAAGVAWFPLAPGEVYRPAYTASRDYFTRVNVTNTVVNVTQVTNIYNNPTRADVRYANVERANAVTAVPTQAFVEARPVHREAMKVEPQAIQRAAMVAAPPIAPVKASIVGGAPLAQAHPTPAVVQRAVIAKNAPPPAPPPIEQRQQALQRQPGKPLDPAELQKLAPPANAAARPNVKVVQPTTPPKPLPAMAETEAPSQTARLQNERATPAPPPRAGQRQNGEKETPQAPTGARPDSEVRSQPAPAAPGAQSRNAPAPAPGATESQRPPQTAIARPEATPRPGTPAAREGEPLQRPRGPQGEPERAAPPQAAPAPPQPPRPEMSKAQPPRQPEAAPPPRPESANAPPQPPRPEMSKAQPRRQPEAAPPPRPETASAAPPQAPRPEVSRAQPRAQPQPPSRPETANAPPPQAPRPEVSRAQPRAQPQPPSRPETANAPARPIPREASEPPRQQAAAAAPRPPEGRAPPAEAARQAEKAPPTRGREKGKGNERDKDNKNDEK